MVEHTGLMKIILVVLMAHQTCVMQRIINMQMTMIRLFPIKNPIYLKPAGCSGGLFSFPEPHLFTPLRYFSKCCWISFSMVPSARYFLIPSVRSGAIPAWEDFLETAK